MKKSVKELILNELKKGYWCSVSDIAKTTHTDSRTVKRAIYEGIDEKEIKVESTNGREFVFAEYNCDAMIFLDSIDSIEDKVGCYVIKGTTSEYVWDYNESEELQSCKKVSKPIKVTLGKKALEDINEIVKSEVPFF